MYGLFDNVEKVKLAGPQAAGVTVLTFDVTAGNVDAGTAVCVVVDLNTVVGGVTGTCKLQESIDNATWVDIPGCSRVLIAGDSNKPLLLDSLKRTSKFVQLVIDRTGANVAINSILANFYGIVRKQPAVNPGLIYLRRTLS